MGLSKLVMPGLSGPTANTTGLESSMPSESWRGSKGNSIVFVTGYGLTGFHTTQIQSLFAKSGCRFQHILLPACGTKAAEVKPRTIDTDAIRETPTAETPSNQNVILMLHSSAIGPGLNALSQAL